MWPRLTFTAKCGLASPSLQDVASPHLRCKMWPRLTFTAKRGFASPQVLESPVHQTIVEKHGKVKAKVLESPVHQTIVEKKDRVVAKHKQLMGDLREKVRATPWVTPRTVDLSNFKLPS